MYITVVIAVLTRWNRGSNAAFIWFGAHAVLPVKVITDENVIE